MLKAMANLTILFSLLCVMQGSGQDIHFSQFYTVPMEVNPALTGMMNGNYRLSAIYRSQWKSVTAPYSTSGFGAEWSMGGGKRSLRDVVGLGFSAGNDVAGDAKLSTSTFLFSAAYNKAIGALSTKYLGFGLQMGMNSSFLNMNSLRFDEQYNGAPATETINFNDSRYFDVSAGAEYTQNFFQFSSFKIGAAVYHITNPTYSFLNNSSVKVFRKYAFNGGLDYRLNRSLELYPRAWLAFQGPSSELIFGSLARFQWRALARHTEMGFYAGAFYRWKDALILCTRMDLNHLSITFSYDVNVSKLTRVSNGGGAPEISLTYIGKVRLMHRKNIFCPRF